MNRRVKFLFILAVLGIVLQGCMLLNPIKRQPLTISDYSSDLQKQRKTVLLYFQPVLPGRPLNETIWDNLQRPIWDTKESEQIGFTQHYQVTPVIMPVGATGATTVRGTRIVIPFGNAFVSKSRFAIDKTFNKSLLCLTEPCLKDAKEAFDYSVIVSIDEFKVFEDPMNHINFLLKVTSHVTSKVGVTSKQSSYTLDKFKLGTITSTSYGVIEKMNEALNQFTDGVVKDLISNIIGNTQ